MSNRSGKLMPNLDQQSTKVLNLTVLQRMDPYIEQILITAAHVTLYAFDIHLNQWSRKDVEGSLFVVKRSTEPQFQFIVMNRRNTENLVENLLGDFEFEVQVPYLLYRNADQEVNGVWFYNSRECEDIANLFTRILNAYEKIPPKPKVSLNKSEFEELEAIPTSAVIEGPLEPSFNASTSTDIPDDPSFVNFFSTAMNVGYNGQMSRVPLSSCIPNAPPSFAPAVKTPSLPLAFSSPMPLHDDPDPISSSNHVANLLKPSSFFTPPSSSSVLLTPLVSPSMTAAHLQPPLNTQRSHGTPILQPFPPPTPPISLTPSSTPPANYGPISRDQVRDALLMLVQVCEWRGSCFG
ncbi:mRNA-decapping enzyme-like protein isoform X2 [Apium graveolens]|uniref:mRNA-decapping enzyme-like protein isoform X2 n=1 Tax=Apium graveolens TaxID=4045 RepID=UPI003D7926D8